MWPAIGLAGPTLLCLEGRDSDVQKLCQNGGQDQSVRSVHG